MWAERTEKCLAYELVKFPLCRLQAYAICKKQKCRERQKKDQLHKWHLFLKWEMLKSWFCYTTFTTVAAQKLLNMYF